MNPTSLFVSTSRVVLQAQNEDDSDSADLSTSSWADLHRLVPYLRQSLSCTVCANLLVEPYTPSDSLSCQHHVCRACRGGRKKLKPSCSWCKDCKDDAYAENVLLRILLQCYKKLCTYITSTALYRSLVAGGSSLVELINEGAEFKDDYKSSPGLSRSAYSILPCVYPSAPPTAAPASPSNVSPTSPPIGSSQENDHLTSDTSPVASNGSSLYSVFNIGSKMTFKRKTVSADSDPLNLDSAVNHNSAEHKPRKSLSLSGFKKPAKGLKSIRTISHTTIKSTNAASKELGVATIANANSLNLKRKGCRCGNATATPGKLTCCGQRCPCYVDNKACLDCRCKGCRNPHRPGGHKVRPHIPELESYQLHLNPDNDVQTIDSNTQVLSLASPSELAASNAGATVQVLGVYTTQLHPVTTVSSSLPAAILVDDESGAIMDDSSELETSDVEVDC